MENVKTAINDLQESIPKIDLFTFFEQAINTDKESICFVRVASFYGCLLACENEQEQRQVIRQFFSAAKNQNIIADFTSDLLCSMEKNPNTDGYNGLVILKSLASLQRMSLTMGAGVHLNYFFR